MSDSKSPKILITGATGNIGTELTRYLSSRQVPFTAMIRSRKDAVLFADMPTATVIVGDFNDEKSLFAALTGIDRAFLLTNSSAEAEAQQCNFVKAASKAGVGHIVKLSQWAADVHSPVRFLRYHAVVENLIRESGMAYTFLRPNLFMQGLLGFRDTIIHQNKFFGAIGEAKISLVDTRDIAAVAAAALTGTGHENKIYNITGPEALSHQELADNLSKVLGRHIQFVDVPSEALLQMLLGVGFPQWQAEGLVEDYAHYKRGEAQAIADGVFEATGLLPRSFDLFAGDYAALFS
jgi:uncharacterized protein YbjT (DUF2867 family)